MLSASNINIIAVDNATIPIASVNIPHAFGTNAAGINFNTGSTVGAAVASLTLATSSLIQINASCKVALSSNQETNIIIWDATTGTVLHSPENTSNMNDMIRTESASIQVQLAAGKHDIQIQQTAFNGSPGTHRIPVKSATITAFTIG